MLPSMGKIIRMGAVYGWIMPNNQTDNIYFNTQELVSYTGIIESPKVGDEVIYSMSKNAQGPIAACIHKQCTREIVEELIDKFRFNTKTCSFLKKHLNDSENNNFANTNKGNGLGYYINRVGIDLYDSYSADEIERLFAEKLSAEEYAKAVDLLIDDVVKNDSSKSYNLFLKSHSYTKSHKMYFESKELLEKALRVFKGQEGKIKYFKGLLNTIKSLSDRIEITDELLVDIINSRKNSFAEIPQYVKTAILNHKDFNGITLDKETVRTGLFKEAYIDELKDNIKQNKADDMSYLTLIRLQLAFHPADYNPKDDIYSFLINRAKNIIALGDAQRYPDARYLLRLAYRQKSDDIKFDNSLGLYFITLGDYTTTEVDMYMSTSAYKTEDLLRNVIASDLDNSLELMLLCDSNSIIRNRIVKEYEK